MEEFAELPNLRLVDNSDGELEIRTSIQSLMERTGIYIRYHYPGYPIEEIFSEGILSFPMSFPSLEYIVDILEKNAECAKGAYPPAINVYQGPIYPPHLRLIR